MKAETRGLIARLGALGGSKRWVTTILVLAAYVPLLASAPGTVPGDTKLYLYLDPRRLIADSLWTWDNRQLGGWVPHQNVGYLWPTGPWYAIFDFLAVPDWIAHRLWLGTIVASAGMGTYWLARRLGVSVAAAGIAALAYQFSPYVLPYVSRTSALLLPWAFLPWLCGLAAIVAISPTRRPMAVAIFGLLVLSSGGLNATALLMIAAGPIIWIIHARMSAGVSRRDAWVSVGLLGGVSLLVSAWWLAGLFIQGRHGAAVLSYSETLLSTATTSTAPEVLRGLGYWIFYDRNDVVGLTSAATSYQNNLLVMIAGIALVITGIFGISTRHRWRWPLMTMVLIGVILAVGAHPFDDPSPLWAPTVDHPRTALSLALRSSTRAVPLIVLALSLGVGLALDREKSAQRNGSRKRSADHTAITDGGARSFGLTHLAAVLLIVTNSPAVIGGALIDPVMTRPERLPEAWYQTARFLDQRFDAGFTGSVLLMPGLESAAYRWGYPVDPILPGLTKKPFLARDWLPLGSAPLMDLLYALDDSFQSGNARVESVAPVARLLGADTVMVVNSHQYERFGSIRPERVAEIYGDDPPGLRLLATFGSPALNQAPTTGPSGWEEDLVAHPPAEFPEILLYAVEDPSPVARSSSEPVVVAADGSGLVDLAALGLIDGRDVILAEAALDDDLLASALQLAPEVFVTDSNRQRAHHWRSSQDVWGATESAAGVLLGTDLFDARLPVFPDAGRESRTVVVDEAVNARSTSYGPALTFEPEFRPSMAIDGDPHTSWRTGVNFDPVGQSIVVTAADDPLPSLRLVQALDATPLRWITAVDLRVDDGPWTRLELSSASRTLDGQQVNLSQPARRVEVRIAAIAAEDPLGPTFGPGVGFAEMLDADRSSTEVVTPPRRILEFAESDLPISWVFARLRADGLQRWRHDPEATLQRFFTLTNSARYTPQVTVRLAEGLDDRSLMESLSSSTANVVLWPEVFSSGRMHGSNSWWALAAVDDDPASTWWTRSPLDPSAATKDDRLSIPLTNVVNYITIRYPAGETSSTISSITVNVLARGEIVRTVTVDVPPPGVDETVRVELPGLRGERLELIIDETRVEPVVDLTSGGEVPAPIGISELSSDGWKPVAIPTAFDTGCRDDLLALDGVAVSLRVTGNVAEALNGQALVGTVCDSPILTLNAGDHRLATGFGLETGWDVDAVVLRDEKRRIASPATPLTITTERGRRTIDLGGCIDRCWIELPDGWNTGWSATVGDRRLDHPRASAAGRNVWTVDGQRDESMVMTTRWLPQRLMWWALAVSFASVLILVGVLVWSILKGRSRDLSLVAAWPSATSAIDGGPSRTALALVGLILASLVIQPWWGLFVGVAVLIFGRRLAIAVGLLLVAVSLLFVVAQQVRTGATPGFGWPLTFTRAHRPTLAGLVLIWCGIHGATMVGGPRSETPIPPAPS